MSCVLGTTKTGQKLVVNGLTIFFTFQAWTVLGAQSPEGSPKLAAPNQKQPNR